VLEINRKLFILFRSHYQEYRTANDFKTYSCSEDTKKAERSIYQFIHRGNIEANEYNILSYMWKQTDK